MQHIKQRFGTYCFPTCIAMIAGISHEKAIKVVHPRRKKHSNYATNVIQGSKALNKLKILYDWKFNFAKLFNEKKLKFKDIKNPAIICIKYPEQEKYNHVVVWDPLMKKIYDPALDKPLPRRVYEKYYVWYLEIHQK